MKIIIKAEDLIEDNHHVADVVAIRVKTVGISSSKELELEGKSCQTRNIKRNPWPKCCSLRECTVLATAKHAFKKLFTFSLVSNAGEAN